MGVVKDGLYGYWHFKEGFTGNVWENIAPSTKGQYDFTINGALLHADGVRFNGTSDKGQAGNFPAKSDYTIEFGMILNSTPTNTVYLLYGWDSSPKEEHRGINLNTSRLLRYNAPDSTTTTYTMPLNTYVTIQIKRITDTQHALYVNGVFRNNFTTLSFTGLKGEMHIAWDGGSTRLPATVSFIRLYDRALSEQELLQNYQVGKEVGLTEPTIPPSVTIISQSRTKLSPVPPADKSILKFKFDQDVTDWAVMVLGSDYSTGTMAGSGKNVAKNTEISVELTHRMLYQEGDNRINIYGRNSDGLWTPYE